MMFSGRFRFIERAGLIFLDGRLSGVQFGVMLLGRGVCCFEN